MAKCAYRNMRMLIICFYFLIEELKTRVFIEDMSKFIIIQWQGSVSLSFKRKKSRMCVSTFIVTDPTTGNPSL